jgi:hypothetical protein
LGRATRNRDLRNESIASFGNVAFSQGQDFVANQTIDMLLNGTFYTIREQVLSVTDTVGANGFGHGTITTGSDINVSR